MKYTYQGKGIEITDAIRDRLEKKLGKLDRYFRDEVDATVRLRMGKGAQNVCEITIAASGVLLRAEEVTQDMYQSIDRTADKLERQIRKHRTKLDKQLKTLLPEAEEAVPEEENASYDVVRVKKFAMKPMDTEDAIAQMELLGHTFYLFRRAGEGDVCVVYKRSDGSYGLLVPEE